MIAGVHGGQKCQILPGTEVAGGFVSCHGDWGWHSGPHVYEASLLPTELSSKRSLNHFEGDLANGILGVDGLALMS